MNTTFRCECCGRPMPLTLREGTTQARCPHCGKCINLPPSVAALPHPHIDADATEGTPGGSADLVGAAAPASVGERGEQAIASAMPWILSVMLHLGLAVIMLFVAMISIPTDDLPPPTAPKAPNVAHLGSSRILRVSLPGETIAKLPSPDPQNDYRRRPGEDDKLIRRPIGDSTGISLTKGDPEPGGPVIGPDPISGTPFEPIGPIDLGVQADHIVFVIDRSGSMVGKFDSLRVAMYTSVSYLAAEQQFHVILFAADSVQENPPRRLVDATPGNKIALVEFLNGIRPVGQTGPLPALQRAFSVLKNAKKADGTEGVKLMYLLTDGEFRQNDDVVAAISQMNPKGRGQVHINTILYGADPPEAVKVMKMIAEENKGRYTYASLDE